MLRTESLWIGKAEAVRVTFDRARIGFAKLLAHAGRTQCDRFVYTTSDAQLRLARAAVGERARALASVTADGAALRADDEQQYYLLQAPLRSVPMTATQAARINAAMRPAGDAPVDAAPSEDGWRRWLSPRQLEHLQQVRAAPDAGWPLAIGVPMAEAVAAFERVAARAR